MRIRHLRFVVAEKKNNNTTLFNEHSHVNARRRRYTIDYRFPAEQDTTVVMRSRSQELLLDFVGVRVVWIKDVLQVDIVGIWR